MVFTSQIYWKSVVFTCLFYWKTLEALPIEIKSGKDYTVHSALNKLLATPEYNIGNGYVFSNAREVTIKGDVTYLPIYYIMFLNGNGSDEAEILI